VPPTHPERPADAPREFKRELRLLDATMIVMGSMIGSGIFIVSADIARTVGGAGWLLVSWLVAGVVTVMGALSYGELAGMMPRAGGQYVYLREAWNPLVAFVYGWTMFMVIHTGTIAAVAVAFARFTAVLIPALGEDVVLFDAGLFQVTAARVLAIASIVFLTWFNSRGLHGGKILQDVFTIAKTAALLGLILLGLTIGRNAGAIAANFGDFWHASWTRISESGVISVEPLVGVALLGALGASLVGSLFASDAWNNITFTAGEVVKPKRTIPLSLVLGTGTVILLYLLANLAYIVSLPVQGAPGATDAYGGGLQFAASDRVGVAAATMMFGAPAAGIMAVLIMISTFGCNNGLILAGARIYYAMARDGLFFRKAGQLNPKAVPGAALAMQAGWASLLCLSGTYSNLLDYVIFSVLIFYILTVLGLFVLRRTRPEAERPYKAFGYPFIPGLYVLAAAAICLNLLIEKPHYTWPGLLIVLLGVPVYLVWTRIGRKGETTG
jgi:APA family basic amino acid/polyamine antiporter